MNVQVRIALANERDEAFCGAGLQELLSEIDRHGSIQQAARTMHLSYAKALNILNRLESELGQALLIRRKGGAGRGQSELTPFAHRFLRDFTRLRSDIERMANKRFQRFALRYEENAL